MATFYHATNSEALDSILANGLEVGETLCATDADEQIDEPVVFLFVDRCDAEGFGADNFATDAVVLAVEVDDDWLDALIPDPEYDEGQAWGAPFDIDPDDLSVL